MLDVKRGTFYYLYLALDVLSERIDNFYRNRQAVLFHCTLGSEYGDPVEFTVNSDFEAGVVRIQRGNLDQMEECEKWLR